MNGYHSQNWPDEVPEIKETTMDILRQMYTLGNYVLKLMAVALDLQVRDKTSQSYFDSIPIINRKSPCDGQHFQSLTWKIVPSRLDSNAHVTPGTQLRDFVKLAD